MITEERARQLRSVIETVMGDVEDETALSAPEFFPQFIPDGHSYTIGDRFRFDGALYKVNQSHTSQANWTPENAPSLYSVVLIPTNENGEQTEIPVWVQPDSTNPYMIGDKVHYPTAEDDVYESVIDNNSWSPEAYPAGWQRLE